MLGHILGTIAAFATLPVAASLGVGRFFTEIPEPGMMLLFGLSVGALGVYMGQKKKP